MSLDEWLKQKELNAQEFADLVGVTQGYISRLRARKVTPSVVVAVAIRDATNGEVTVDDLLPRKIVGIG